MEHDLRQGLRMVNQALDRDEKDQILATSEK